MSVRYRPELVLASPLCSLVLFLVFATGLARAAVPNAPACGAAPTSEFLNARLTFWQQRLNLQEWTLSVVSSHESDLKPETLGNIHWNSNEKTAVVRVLAPSDYKVACPAALEDMELTVVHELVHLTLSPLRSSATDRGEEEHAVTRIADALLKLERQRPQRETAPAPVAQTTPR